MIPDLLNLLTPEERAAWALCEGATPGPWVDMTSAGHDVGAFDGEIRAATLAEQQRAFVIGLDLAQRTAFTEADPVPARRNCRSCTHATGDHLGRPMCGVGEGEYGVAEWRAYPVNVDDDGHCRPDADNCPGYTLRLTESAARITVGQ